MKLSFLLVFISLIFTEETGWWGCQDPNALNYDPYAFWDCGWCCEYEDEDNTTGTQELSCTAGACELVDITSTVAA